MPDIPSHSSLKVFGCRLIFPTIVETITIISSPWITLTNCDYYKLKLNENLFLIVKKK